MMTLQRASVREEAYSVLAIVPEEEFKSDQVAAAIRIELALRERGHRPEVLREETGPISVRIFLGEARDEVYEDAAMAMLEAASW